MEYFYLLVLLFGLSTAAQIQQPSQPAPVYRSAPTILNAVPNKSGPVAQTLTAEERESQVYASPPQDPNVKPVPLNANTVGQPQVSPETQQTFKVYYFPSSGTNQYVAQQPQTGYPSTYQAGVGTGGVGQPETNGVASYFNSINWNNYLVGAAVLGLVGVGSAMWYPRLVGYSARAMRELSDLKTDDAAEMARGILKAIGKYSELNNAK